MNEICNCECHSNASIMHFMPCCISCPTCEKNIISSMYKKHIENCNVNNKMTISDMETIMSNTNIKIFLKGNNGKKL